MAGGHRLLAQGGVMTGLAAVALLVVATPWVLHQGEESAPTELYWYYGKWMPDLTYLAGPPQHTVAAAAKKHSVAAAAKKHSVATDRKTKAVSSGKEASSAMPSFFRQQPLERAEKERATTMWSKAAAPKAAEPKVSAEPKAAAPLAPKKLQNRPASQNPATSQKPKATSSAHKVLESKHGLKTDTPDGARKLKIDMTLRGLKEEARQLGVNLGDGQHKVKSTLDEWSNVDMPVPNLEPGTSTPELPFPPKGSPGNDEARAVASQSLAEADYAIGPSVVVGPTEPASKDSKMAAPAWSPYYLEPTRHPDVDSSAWKWAAALRQHRLAERAAQAQAKAGKSSKAAAEASPGVGAPSKGASSSKAAMEASESELALVDAAVSQAPCPWYGCADGSNAWFSKGPPSPTSQLAAQSPSVSDLSMAEQILAQQKQHKQHKQHRDKGARADQRQIAGAALFEHAPQLHLAHGFGTTNAYTADPITAEKNQYYGGEHRHYGSERPVTSNGDRTVSGKEAYANDMAPAYDIDEPSSFDSIPLASPSSFAARVAAHQPSGDGKLKDHHMRADVLAAWREYEHGLSQCMQAEATIDPSLKDFSCDDVEQGLGYLRDCMQNHQFGLQDMPLTRREKLRHKVFAAWGASDAADKQQRLQNGAWGALPKLVQLSYQLQPTDYKAVYSVLQQSAVFNTLWHLERLHTRCASTGSAVRPEESTRDKIRNIDSEIRFADRYMDLYGPWTPEQRRGEAILQGVDHGMPWEYAGVRRGAVRNYWPHVHSAYPDPTRPNLPYGEYYGHENGYFPQPLHPHEPTRTELPRWRQPHSDEAAEDAAAHPLVDQGQPFAHPRPQPRARLNPNHKWPSAFPVNGKKVNPYYPRPWQVSSGAPDVWQWAYPPRPADVRQPYTCIDDWHCPSGSVCSTLGVCRVWEDTGLWHTPEAVYETNLTPDWV